jgi:hypothetical protein
MEYDNKKDNIRKVRFLNDVKLDLLRFRCQNNAKKNGLNCPMFAARYLKQNYNFCSTCNHLNLSIDEQEQE